MAMAAANYPNVYAYSQAGKPIVFQQVNPNTGSPSSTDSAFTPPLMVYNYNNPNTNPTTYPGNTYGMMPPAMGSNPNVFGSNGNTAAQPMPPQMPMNTGAYPTAPNGNPNQFPFGQTPPNPQAGGAPGMAMPTDNGNPWYQAPYGNNAAAPNTPDQLQFRSIPMNPQAVGAPGMGPPTPNSDPALNPYGNPQAIPAGGAPAPAAPVYNPTMNSYTNNGAAPMFPGTPGNPQTPGAPGNPQTVPPMNGTPGAYPYPPNNSPMFNPAGPTGPPQSTGPSGIPGSYAPPMAPAPYGYPTPPYA